MKSIQDQVLDLFKDEISTRLDKNWKEIPLELDYDLFDAPGDDLHDALNKFEQKFNVDLSSVKWSCYFPWENTPMLTRWFKVKREDVEKTRKLQNAGIRVKADLRNEKIGFKIREHTLRRVPYMLVCGDKEVEAGKVAVRTRRGKDLGSMDVNEVIEKLQQEIRSRSLQQLEE